MAREEGLRDGQVDDGVAEELEPFVVAAGGCRGAREPADVDERLVEEVEIADGEAEPFGEGVGRSHDLRGPRVACSRV